MPLFTLVLPLRTLFCSDQNELTRFLRLIVIKSWIKQVKSVWLLFLDPLKIQYFVMSMFLTGELHAEAWTRFLYQHTDPWLCSHLVFGHCCLGADTKQCCVQTLGTPSIQVPFSARVQRQDLRALILCSAEFWAPCSGTQPVTIAYGLLVGSFAYVFASHTVSLPVLKIAMTEKFLRTFIQCFTRRDNFFTTIRSMCSKKKVLAFKAR